MTQQLPALENILCIRLRSLGDAVLMTPALTALRRAFPRARVDVLLEEWLRPLLENHPAVDSLIAMGRESKLSLARRLRALRYDAVLNFHGGPTSAFLTAASGARYRVGRSTYRYGFVYNRKAPLPEEIFRDRPVPHTVHYQASLVGALGVPPGELELALSLSVHSAALGSVERKLHALGLPSSGYVVIQPSASFETKRWPAARFIEIAQALRNRETPVVVSLPDQNLERDFSSFPTVSALPVDELAALISRSRLYFGNDSGPMHVAAALGVPVVAIFGSSDPRRWHPWGVPHRALWAGLACSPCHGKWCANPETHACLTALSTAQALDGVFTLLSSGSSRGALSPYRDGAPPPSQRRSRLPPRPMGSGPSGS